MALFEDRASLRVTDVSSVVYRDVVLWYLYRNVRGHECPRMIQEGQLDELEAYQRQQNATFEEAAAGIIKIETWSTSI